MRRWLAILFWRLSYRADREWFVDRLGKVVKEYYEPIIVKEVREYYRKHMEEL